MKEPALSPSGSAGGLAVVPTSSTGNCTRRRRAASKNGAVIIEVAMEPVCFSNGHPPTKRLLCNVTSVQILRDTRTHNVLVTVEKRVSDEQRLQKRRIALIVVALGNVLWRLSVVLAKSSNHGGGYTLREKTLCYNSGL
jgi:hypothetical protein